MIWLIEILAWTTASDEALRGTAFDIAKNPHYDEFQTSLVSMVYNVLIKKPQVNNDDVNNEIKQNNNWLKNYTNQLLKK